MRLRHLKPDENGMVRIVSSRKSKVRFENLITYEKALIHVKEGSALVKNRNTIIKLHSQKQMRELVFERDKYKCHYCGKQGLTLDHMTPRSKGGCSTPKNLVCCCYECNQKKGSLSYKEFIRIIRKEVKTIES
jgi:hypothetical protein